MDFHLGKTMENFAFNLISQFLFYRYCLKEQAKLVIQENKFLLEQKYIQKNTVEELTRDYLDESKLLLHEVKSLPLPSPSQKRESSFFRENLY